MEGDGGVAMGEEMENVQPGFGGGGFEEKIGFDQAATATQGFGFNAGHGPTEVKY